MTQVLYPFFTIFFLVFISTTSSAEYFVINDYDVQMRIADDGYLFVEETIEVTFSEDRRGIFRTIPINYTIDDTKVGFKIDQEHVDKWEYKVYDENGKRVIRIGNSDKYVNGKQTYKISYRVRNAYVWHENQAELYWNVISHEWEVPIEHISYRIEFPERLDIPVTDYKIYTGAYEEREISAGIQKLGNYVKGESTRIFNPGEGLSIAVLMPRGFIEKPNRKKEFYQWFGEQSKSLPLPFAVFAFLFYGWRRYGKNDHPTLQMTNAHYPPENLSASEAGLFIDNHVHNRDLIALIPEWGRAGYIRIRQIDPDAKKKAENTYLEKIDSLPAGLPEYQQIVFDGLFKNSDLALISDLNNKMYSYMAKAGGKLKKEVRTKRLYDPTAYKIFHSGWMIGLFFLLLILGILSMILFQEIIMGISMIIIGIWCFILHFLAPKKTEEGVRIHQQLKLFRDFLKESPPDKMAGLFEKDSDYFDKIYPFVLAFGLEKSFYKSSEIFIPWAPSWYYFHDRNRYHQRPSFSDFSDGFNVKSITSAFTSSPQTNSPGGGGVSGGGSVGGGFGGGGGGSW